jgi:hypothetical protein
MTRPSSTGWRESPPLPRHAAPGLLVPLADFWLFDDRLVRFGFFTGVGTFLRHELCDDPEVIRSCVKAFEQVWCWATPHREYRPA